MAGASNILILLLLTSSLEAILRSSSVSLIFAWKQSSCHGHMASQANFQVEHIQVIWQVKPISSKANKFDKVFEFNFESNASGACNPSTATTGSTLR
jgi:hypothetical protein